MVNCLVLANTLNSSLKITIYVISIAYQQIVKHGFTLKEKCLRAPVVDQVPIELDIFK